MLTFAQTREANEEFYGARKPIKIWYVDVNDIVISKLIKTKINSKFLTGYLDDFIRPLVLLLSKMK